MSVQRDDAAASVDVAVPRVALVMVAIGDLTASGGAERQFSDVFEHFRRIGVGHVSLITARSSVTKLRAAGRLKHVADVIALPLGPAPAVGRLNVVWMTALLTWITLVRGFDVVHLCLPTPSYVPFAAIVTRLPRRLRPRVTLNVIDCTLTRNLTGSEPADVYEQQVVDAHRLYFRWARLDGIYTWYQAFAEVCRAQRLVAPNALIRASRFCFTDPQRFRPQGQKEHVVVFAGRLSEQKRPSLFVEAVAVLRTRSPQLINGWRFEMYGGGVLEGRVREMITERGLQDLVLLTRTADMAPVFARTRLFVSTQAHENFTSLAMLEAMAAGNAIVAENVGQTYEFVRAGENGLLVSPASAETFAAAIAEYLDHPEWHDRMAAASRAVTTTVHTVDHFAADVAAFWRDVVAES